MKQTTNINTPIPTEFSPEFTSWLEKEQEEARRHRSQVMKMTLMAILIGSALFIFKEQPNWVQYIVDVAQGVNP